MSADDAAAAPAYPAFMAKLIDRAALLLWRQWPRTTMVDFAWRADGEDLLFTATVEWREGPAPCIVITRRRSGEFVCKSLCNDWFAIDPSIYGLDPGEDEIDRLSEPDAQRPQRGRA